MTAISDCTKFTMPGFDTGEPENKQSALSHTTDVIPNRPRSAGVRGTLRQDGVPRCGSGFYNIHEQPPLIPACTCVDSTRIVRYLSRYSLAGAFGMTGVMCWLSAEC